MVPLPQVLVTVGSQAVEVAEIDVEFGQPIKKEMFFNLDQSELYVMTSKKV